MSTRTQDQCIAFAGSTRIARGTVADVAREAKMALDASSEATVLIFDAETSRPIEIDFRGSVEEVIARLGESPATMEPAPRSPGRPKLGVVAREVTLLPRHWEWLATQPGGASVTLRKLVENARKENSEGDRQRSAQDATYRFAVAMAGNETGFEESMRALYAGDRGSFDALTEGWPTDVRDHARMLATNAFGSDGG